MNCNGALDRTEMDRIRSVEADVVQDGAVVKARKTTGEWQGASHDAIRCEVKRVEGGRQRRPSGRCSGCPHDLEHFNGIGSRNGGGKPLRRLPDIGGAVHRAEAPVLMRDR